MTPPLAPEKSDLLNLLAIGLRIDTAHLQESAATLAVSLRAVRHFSGRPPFSEIEERNWQWNWNTVDAVLTQTEVRMKEMAANLDTNEAGHLQRAMAAWEAIECEDDRLQTALTLIRKQAMSLDLEARKDWNRLAHASESELEHLHTQAQALRIKLELFKSHSPEESERIARNLATRLPARPTDEGTTPELYDHELRHAITALEAEQHEFLGSLDVLKGLLMWVETPEERMRRNRSLSVGLGP